MSKGNSLLLILQDKWRRHTDGVQAKAATIRCRLIPLSSRVINVDRTEIECALKAAIDFLVLP